jgi:hypothetical protein
LLSCGWVSANVQSLIRDHWPGTNLVQG